MNTERFKIDDRCLLLIVDVQEKLIHVMSDPEGIEKRFHLLIELSKAFEIPVLLTEQYPLGLGPTIQSIRNGLPQYQPYEKTSFSIWGDAEIREKLKSHKSRKIILTGIESHICVLQSCLDLLGAGFTVWVPYDAVDSRSREDRRIGLNLMEKAGATISGCETITFQLLKTSGTPEFKHISKIIKALREPNRG